MFAVTDGAGLSVACGSGVMAAGRSSCHGFVGGLGGMTGGTVCAPLLRVVRMNGAPLAAAAVVSTAPLMNDRLFTVASPPSEVWWGSGPADTPWAFVAPLPDRPRPACRPAPSSPRSP